jgi:hypothetical protein
MPLNQKMSLPEKLAFKSGQNLPLVVLFSAFETANGPLQL